MWTAKEEDVALFYPECLNNGTARVVVPATFDRAETVGSILRISFGVGFWLAFVVHAFGVETYVCCPLIIRRWIYYVEYLEANWFCLCIFRSG